MTSAAQKKRLELYAIDLEIEHRRRKALRSKPLIQYRTDPVGYAVERLGIAPESLDWTLCPEYRSHTWDGSVNPIKAMFDGLARGEDVGVESATGTGKSFGAAILVLWFLACWEGGRVFTFAPKEDQLRDYIWMELQKLFPKFKQDFPDATLTDLALRVKGDIGKDEDKNSGWAAYGRSVGIGADEDVATKAAGMHAAHMLLIYEETQGQHAAVLAAGENTCTAPHNLRLYIGNPDHQLDQLHLACIGPDTTHIIISALDHPNVVTGREIVPGAVSRVTVERRRAKYGTEHRLYKSRIRGISPAESSDALIKMEWINASVARWKAALPESWDKEPDALGVDVANSETGDEAGIAHMKGRRVMVVDAFACPNANDLGMMVGKRIDREKINPYYVGVDPGGVGAATLNELRKKPAWQSVRALNASYAPEVVDWDAEDYCNLRAQMHWWLAEDLRLGEIDLPDDPELHLDLITPTWELRNGKILIESKEKIKERTPNHRSPNKGDALAFANFVRPRPEPRAETPRVRYDGERYPAEIRTVPVPPSGIQSRPDLTPMKRVGEHTGHMKRVPAKEKITSADGF